MRFPLAFLLVLFAFPRWGAIPAWADTSARLFKDLEASVPGQAADCTAARTQAVVSAAEALEAWGAERAWEVSGEDPTEVLAELRTMIAAKRQVDRHLEQTLDLRTQMAALPANEQRRETLRQYLQITSQLIDLSGRLRYLLSDAIDNASYDLSPHPQQLDEMLELLLKNRLSVGAAAMAFALRDPPAESGLRPFPPPFKSQVIELISISQDASLVPVLANMLREPHHPPALRVLAAEGIRRLGLPQEPRAKNDPDVPLPAITPKELYAIIAGLDFSAEDAELSARRQELLDWLEIRKARGITEASYRVGGYEVCAGDWLLMRNPSPYNRFTDLSPGLFTHVGVVAVEDGSDGIRRFVIVDLPERGEHIPATNVDAYVERTLHYFFLRHPDAAVAQKMGEVAASLIGNETQFDLLFRTDRVLELKGQSLSGQRIHTYCAGLLLLCAQETSAAREDFFPIAESPAGGNCLRNLAKLGLSIGEDFVSPSGAIFSAKLQIVGGREPMYDPGREIKEAVYDHFALAMITQELTPAPDAQQLLRQKVAALSKRNRWLAQALAKASNVSQHMDLESAAKAAAVVETLDEIADANMIAFYEARQAILAGPAERFTEDGFSAADIQRILDYRRRHADLWREWTSDRLSPLQLRVQLVRYYTARGRQQLDERFFRS